MLLAPFGGEAHPPTSFDVPYYVWRTRLVAIDGLDALARIPDGAVPHPDRAGFPALGAVLMAVTRLDALTLVVVLRAVAAISIGAAAAAFARESLQEPSWSWPWFVLGVGASAAVIGAAIGSLEQLVVEVLLMGTAALVPLVAHGRRGIIATAVLLAAAGLTHWIFTGLFLGVLLGVVVALALLSLRGRAETNGDVEPPSRPVVRVAGLIAGGIAAAGIALLLLPSLPTTVPGVVGEKGNLTRLGSYELALLLPLAVLGSVLGLWGARGMRRTGIVVMTVWAAAVPVSMIVSTFLPTPLKLFRVAPFALGIPVLATLAIVTAARLSADRLGTAGRVTAAIVLLGGLLLAIGTPMATFDTGYGRLVTERMEQAQIAGRFVRSVARGRPVVFTTRGDPVLIDRVVRAWVPADVIPDTWVYVGAPRDLARGEPVNDQDRLVLTRSSQAWWHRAWPDPAGVLDRDPLVIDIGAVDRPPPPGFVALAPGLSTAEASRAAGGPSSVGAGWWELTLGTGAILMVLAFVGGGWARALLDVSPVSAALLTPAAGTAALIVAGAAIGRAGVPIGDAWGVGLVFATGGAGWLLSTGKRAR